MVMTTPKINEYISYMKNVAVPGNRFHQQFINRMNEVIKEAEKAEALEKENNELRETLNEIHRQAKVEQRRT